MKILLNWFISTLVIIAAAYLLPGIMVGSFLAALVTALVLGLLNSILKPILFVLTLPINVLTLGLFTIVINALIVMLAGYAVPGFDVANFWWALLFGLLLSIINTFFAKKK